MIANWLSTVEQRLAEGDLEDLAVALVSLAYAAGTEIEIPEDERRGATRRGSTSRPWLGCSTPTRSPRPSRA